MLSRYRTPQAVKHTEGKRGIRIAGIFRGCCQWHLAYYTKATLLVSRPIKLTKYYKIGCYSSTGLWRAVVARMSSCLRVNLRVDLLITKHNKAKRNCRRWETCSQRNPIYDSSVAYDTAPCQPRRCLQGAACHPRSQYHVYLTGSLEGGRSWARRRSGWSQTRW